MECFCFLSETTRPGCNLTNHFGPITLCVQKIINITLKKQDSGSDQDLIMVLLFKDSVTYKQHMCVLPTKIRQ